MCNHSCPCHTKFVSLPTGLPQRLPGDTEAARNQAPNTELAEHVLSRSTRPIGQCEQGQPRRMSSPEALLNILVCRKLRHSHHCTGDSTSICAPTLRANHLSEKVGSHVKKACRISGHCECEGISQHGAKPQIDIGWRQAEFGHLRFQEAQVCQSLIDIEKNCLHSHAYLGRDRHSQRTSVLPRTNRSVARRAFTFALLLAEVGVMQIHDLRAMTTIEFHGAICSGGGDRTHDPRINSPLLCQLSYPGIQRSEAYPQARRSGMAAISSMHSGLAMASLLRTRRPFTASARASSTSLLLRVRGKSFTRKTSAGT